MVHLALRQDGHEPIFRHLQGDSAYYDLITSLWAKGETFIIVEHDIIVWPGAINAIEECKEPWCCYPYFCSVGWIEDGLGCTKFSAEFIARYPDFFKEPFPACCNHSTHYCGLDRFIAHRAKELGIRAHLHSPGVVNLNSRWT